MTIRTAHSAMILALLALPGWASGGQATSQPQRPNVIILLADDMGFSDAGCHGSEIQTPNLDRLAEGGLRFTQFYNTGRCWPSRACVMTGYYAQAVRRDSFRNGEGGAKGTRPKWARLLPELLGPLGYRSYHSGKWHIDGQRLAGGFDRSYSLEDHDRHFAPRKHFKDDRPLPAVEPGSGYYSSTAIADHAIACLKDHAANHDNAPFFSYICFTAPHFPLQAPPEAIARCREYYAPGWDIVRGRRWARLKASHIVECPLPPLEQDVGPPYDFPEAFAKLGPGEVRFPRPWLELTAEQRDFQATKMAIHAAMIECMDREIGRIVAQLEAMGAFENTLIFFASDNGASAEIMVRGDGHDPAAAPGSAGSYLCLGPGWSSVANTPLRRHKTWVHEGGIATPLIVHWPAGIADHYKLRRTPGHLVDLAPTILELAGGQWPRSFNGTPVPRPHGRSLVPALADDVVIKRDSLWWLHEDNRAIRIDDWKLVRAARPGGRWELYDIARDRGETHDLAAVMPDKARELEQAWSRQAAECRAYARPD